MRQVPDGGSRRACVLLSCCLLACASQTLEGGTHAPSRVLSTLDSVIPIRTFRCVGFNTFIACPLGIGRYSESSYNRVEDSKALIPVGGDPSPATPKDLPAPPGRPAEQSTLAIGGYPIIRYNTDIGMGIGARAEVYLRRQGYHPYQAKFGARVFATTAYVLATSVYADLPSFPSAGFRLEAETSFNVGFANYYGVGNGPAPSYAGPVGDAELSTSETEELRHRLDRYYHQYFNRGYTISSSLQRQLLGYASLALGLSVRHVDVRPYDSALLERFPHIVNQEFVSQLQEEMPHGVSGGDVLSTSGRFVLDSRDQETAPTRGSVVETSFSLSATRVRENGQLATVPHAYASTGLKLRHFLPFRPNLVIAFRLDAAFQMGVVPFFQMASLGGTMSGRGIPQDRYRGKIRVLSTTELRATVAQFNIVRKPLALGLVLFSDSGRVWADYAFEGAPMDIHASLGAGFRFTWDRLFVIRCDAAYAVTDRTHGYYIDLHHAF